MGKEYIRRQAVVGNVDILGEVLLFDQFERGWHIFESPTSTDKCILLDHAAALTGELGLKLQTVIIDPADNDTVLASMYFSIRPSKLIRLQSSFKFPEIGDEKYLDFTILAYIDSSSYTARIRVEPLEEKIYLYNSAGGYTEITDIPLHPYDAYWYSLDLILNLSTGYYKKLTIGHLEADISAYDIKSAATAKDSRATLTLTLTGNGEGAATVYIDHILISEILI